MAAVEGGENQFELVIVSNDPTSSRFGQDENGTLDGMKDLSAAVPRRGAAASVSTAGSRLSHLGRGQR
jgi:hypothetical protein